MKQVTKVISRMPPVLAWLVLAIPPLWGQGAAPPAAAALTASALYQQLSSAGLDPAKVYGVRDAALDRGGVHISLDDGTIAFTHDILGRATGAYFSGDGEVLVIPPDQAERISLGLFIGTAVLEDKFDSAYLRFNDDTAEQLRPFLRPAPKGQEFVSRLERTARDLAESDALRLLLTFSRLLPAGHPPPPSTAAGEGMRDRLLHVRLHSERLGNYDVYFDSESQEQVSVGQLGLSEGTNYFDLWTSFSTPWERGQLKNRAEQPAWGDDVEISQYRIRAQVDPPHMLDAEALLNLEVRQGGERTLLFELSRFLQVKQVEADGQAVEFIHNQALEGSQLARRGNDLVAVVFPQPLAPGQPMRLRFVYGGSVLSEAGAGLLYVGARGTWYPNRGMAMSNFDTEFRYPAGWTLVATGKRVSPEKTGKADAAPAEQVSRWLSERPIPFAGFNLGRYQRASARAGAVVVESYAAPGVEHSFPRGRPEILDDLTRPEPLGHTLAMPPLPPSPASNAAAAAEKSAHAIEYFARRLGPFPYSSLALTQMPGGASQGWPGLVFLSSFAFLRPEELARLRLSPMSSILYSQVMLVHETAHQWWGDLVGWKSYRDQWIMEALSNYCALMMLERERPAEFSAVLQDYREGLGKKNKQGVPLQDAGPVTLGIRLSSSKFPAGYDAISYGRGTWLFHMLRHMLRDAGTTAGGSSRGRTDRDQLFFQTLRRLCERFAGKAINTADLQAAFEQELPRSLWFEGKKSLDWFFQGWVNGIALPSLELSHVKFSHHNGASLVSGTILQKDAPEDLVTSVPIYAAAGSRAPVLLGRVFADGPETSFRLTAPPGTRRLVIDPYQTVLTRPR